MPYDSLTREEARQLCDRLLDGTPEALEDCLSFFEADSKGLWHNRARAKLARRFKHISLSPHQQARVMNAIIRRFISGDFSEQFVDQLHLALRIEASQLYAAAERVSSDAKPHIRKCADWILADRSRIR